jgi:uncharacterized protein YcgI (DUF1989 family)
MSGLTAVPARRGKAARMKAGQTIKIINTHGTQVLDTWAFRADDLHEFMSMEHTRPQIGKIIPIVGDALRSNKRTPMLTWLEDTSPGIHDTLVAACDVHRYRHFGVKDYHDNCTDNLHAAMKELGLTPPEVPCPLNMWMNIPVGADHRIAFLPTVSKPGDYVMLRAEMDLIMAFSACPMDVTPINGPGGDIKDCHFEIR